MSTSEITERNRRRLVGMGLLSPDRYEELTGQKPPGMHERADEPTVGDLKAELASTSGHLPPEQRRESEIARATAARDRDRAFLASAERLALAGADEATAAAIRAQYDDERRAVEQRFERATAEGDRLLRIALMSRAVKQERLVHGGDYDRFDLAGVTGEEAERDRREVEDKYAERFAGRRQSTLGLPTVADRRRALADEIARREAQENSG
jgi:hypothetical protein